MSKLSEMRRDYLESGSEVLEHYLSIATGKGPTLPAGMYDDTNHKTIVENITEMIKTVDDPVPITQLTDGDIAERVDAVLAQVSEGKITPDEGKRLLALLQAGFTLTDLPKLLAALEAAS